MDGNQTKLKLLLVDDEADFRRATSNALGRRGFTVTEAASGEQALTALKRDLPDIIVLDLKMPGMSGIETLQKIRTVEESIPVIILTGHGDFQSALAGIKLKIVDFLQKPVDIDQLGARIRSLSEKGIKKPLREPTIAELMVSPAIYPKVHADAPVKKTLEALRHELFRLPPGGGQGIQVRSARVYDRDDKFLGMIRILDLLKLVLPPFLEGSPYSTFFTGMFLAQCKLIGKRDLRELLSEQARVDVNAPLMEAVHLMVKQHVVNLPVMKEGELVGVLRGREVIIEVADSMGGASGE